MTNRARDLLYNYLDEDKARSKTKNDQLEIFLKSLEKDLQPFLKAAHKFAKTGDIDSDALKLNDKECEIVSDQENAGTKKGSRRKKMPTLTENTTDNIETVKVKKEKISEISQPASARNSIESTTSSVVETTKENIKLEKDGMPAPNWIPPKKKGKEIKTERASVRTTRTKGKKAAETSHARDSDCIVHNATITTISLSDTEESDNEKLQKEETAKRSTRTKTRKQTQTLDSGTDTDSESARSTRTKTRTKKVEPNVETEEVEETRSTRTKTRKGKKVEEESVRTEPEESQKEVRSTRTKTIRKGKDPEETNETKLPDNNKEEIVAAESTRSTRTKTRKPVENIEPPSKDDESDSAHVEQIPKSKSKRHRSDSTDEEVVIKDLKKSKSNSPVVPRANTPQGNTTTQTVFEDARSTLEPPQERQLNSTFMTNKQADPKTATLPIAPPLNATVTIDSKTPSAANCTMTIEHPKYNIFEKKSNNDMFTDDDSIEVKTPPKKVAPAAKKSSKEMFSPYEKTALKKKVEAFEKLQNVSEIPVKTSSIAKGGRDTPSSVKEKAKMFTPSGLRFMPGSSSTTKISRLISQQHNASTSNDSFMGSKSTQKDPRERQKKQLEREQALKKKEAMLQAQTDAKRKLNEEKQLKALHQRKILEAEKLKQLELQKQKEERLKQRELEREEYLQKQRHEQEKKRIAQKKKYQELQVQKLQEANAKPLPVYMVTPAPTLPTDDCYDSDEPGYKKVTAPSWCSGEQAKIMQLAMLTAGEKIKNTLFCRHAQTPDLSKIFETIDPKKLKRSSSILWKKPPRYTMMPDLNETRFSDDEELYDSDD